MGIEILVALGVIALLGAGALGCKDAETTPKPAQQTDISGEANSYRLIESKDGAVCAVGNTNNKPRMVLPLFRPSASEAPDGGVSGVESNRKGPNPTIIKVQVKHTTGENDFALRESILAQLGTLTWFSNIADQSKKDMIVDLAACMALQKAPRRPYTQGVELSSDEIFASYHMLISTVDPNKLRPAPEPQPAPSSSTPRSAPPSGPAKASPPSGVPKAPANNRKGTTNYG